MGRDAPLRRPCRALKWLFERMLERVASWSHGRRDEQTQWLGSMADRVGHPRPMAAAAHGDPGIERSEAPQGPIGRIKHCWVVDDYGQLPSCWSGAASRLASKVDDPDMGWIVVEEWLPAECLEPT